MINLLLLFVSFQQSLRSKEKQTLVLCHTSETGIPFHLQNTMGGLSLRGLCSCFIWKQKLCFFLLIYLFYLKAKVTERGKDTRKALSSSGSLSKWSLVQNYASLKLRGQELLLGPLCGCRGPETWAILLHFSRLLADS